MTTKTPALWSFVGIYFNQDWPEDYGTEQASINAFLGEDPGSAGALLSEIERVLDEFPTEEQLAEYLDSQGSEYIPPAAEGGYRAWLTRIADHVRTATQR